MVEQPICFLLSKWESSPGKAENKKCLKPLLWYINCHANSISSHTWLQHAKILTGSCISGSPFSAANLRQPQCQQRNKFPPFCAQRNGIKKTSRLSSAHAMGSAFAKHDAECLTLKIHPQVYLPAFIQGMNRVLNHPAHYPHQS